MAAGETNGAAGAAVAETPRSVQIASRGIRTATQACEFSSALIGDIMTEQVPVRNANAALSSLRSLIRVADMQHRYGAAGNKEPINLVPGEAPPADETQKRIAALKAELEALERAG